MKSYIINQYLHHIFLTHIRFSFGQTLNTWYCTTY